METSALPDQVVIFDGVCNLCEFSVNFIYTRDSAGRFTFTPAQSPLGKHLLEKFGIDTASLDTVVLVTRGRALTRSTAALDIARELDSPWNLLSLLGIVPTFLRDWIYDIIAAHRYQWFGRKESCMLPGADLKSRFREEL